MSLVSPVAPIGYLDWLSCYIQNDWSSWKGNEIALNQPIWEKFHLVLDLEVVFVYLITEAQHFNSSILNVRTKVYVLLTSHDLNSLKQRNGTELNQATVANTFGFNLYILFFTFFYTLRTGSRLVVTTCFLPHSEANGLTTPCICAINITLLTPESSQTWSGCQQTTPGLQWWKKPQTIKWRLCSLNVMLAAGMAAMRRWLFFYYYLSVRARYAPGPQLRHWNDSGVQTVLRTFHFYLNAFILVLYFQFGTQSFNLWNHRN